MTEFSIYQINTDRDNNRVCFLGLDTLERFQHSKEVDPVLYDRVYDGKLDCNSLETIYEKFNINHPADYKGRSLSVSDVVEIRESDTLNPGFYFVDSIGFKSISFDKSPCKEPVKASDGKISVLLVEPNKYPKMIEIDDTLEVMQTVVGGDIEEYMPFEDEVAIICNEEGKSQVWHLIVPFMRRTPVRCWTLSAGSFSLSMLPLKQRGFSPSRLTLRRNTVRNSNTPNAL